MRLRGWRRRRGRDGEGARASCALGGADILSAVCFSELGRQDVVLPEDRLHFGVSGLGGDEGELGSVLGVNFLDLALFSGLDSAAFSACAF